MCNRELLPGKTRESSQLYYVNRSSKGKGRDTDSQEATVYLEDIDSSMPKAPRTEAKERGENSPASVNKSRWRDYDPYKLPDVDIKDVMAKATRARVPDPRLATEEELQAIIDHLRPEDLDMTSDAFRDLPTEVQYEIIGDLRLKSRQPSHRRLQEILKVSKTPMDFSKAQIRGVKQRADLTQQLLETTDSVGKAHLPNTAKRIASERDREYVLVRNENAEGGWILGIRDDGTAEKPIVIDKDDDEPDSEPADDDSDMEEVEMYDPFAYILLGILTTFSVQRPFHVILIYANTDESYRSQVWQSGKHHPDFALGEKRSPLTLRMFPCSSLNLAMRMTVGLTWNWLLPYKIR